MTQFMNEKYPFVVFVILSCNQKDVTLECLESVSQCDYTSKQIILVDNGSSDGTIEAINRAFPEVKCLRNERNLGAAAGRNCGIEYAKKHYAFDYIMFMDNDIVVRPNFLTKLVNGLQREGQGGAQIASPKLYQMGTEDILDCAGGAKVNFYTGSTQTRGHGEKDSGQFDKTKYPHCVPATVLLHRKALERAGCFDVSFDPYGYEDLDFVLRANAPGTPFLFVPDAVVYHKGSKTGFTGYSAEYAKVKAANLRRFFKRHSRTHHRIVFYCVLPFLALKPIFRELRKGNVTAVWGLIRGFIASQK